MFLIPAILIDDEGIRVAMFHSMNEIKLWQMVILKRDFRSLIETVHSTSPTMRIGSGSLSMLFRADSLHPSRVGAKLLSDNLS
ncbi:Phosphoribosyl-AMP cyclohydrolase [Labeo rohita]|uniref:Phosphoribosyl-AMP cyclohydrolase n=1 Tax=Labeo rohita TaxID=84645 RepID=A0ABQ8L0G5_LABRO|nr:Phosphoribosyl-AMP cyclohydrolase [Labeo rohita]